MNAEMFLRDIVDSGRLTPHPMTGMNQAMADRAKYSTARELHSPKAHEHKRNAALYEATCFSQGMQNTINYLGIIAASPQRNLRFELMGATMHRAFPPDMDFQGSFYNARHRVVVDLSPAACDQSEVIALDNTFHNTCGMVRLQGVAVDLLESDLERFHQEVQRTRKRTLGDSLARDRYTACDTVELHLLFSIEAPFEFAWVTTQPSGRARYQRLIASHEDSDAARKQEALFVPTALDLRQTASDDAFTMQCETAVSGVRAYPSIDLPWLGKKLEELGLWLRRLDHGIKPQRQLGTVVF